MAAPKTIRNKAGAKRAAGSVQEPPNTQDLAAAVVQLQESVNKLIAAFNTHQHSALNAAPAVGTIAGSATVAAVDLFTTPPTS